ncbi:MAG: MFS transporter, partial [Acidocella sp.]|nr:MFS transporter [Acidocella sp.]
MIGLPLAVLPGLVHFNLGYSAAFAGFMISLQYAATLATRSVVGLISDSFGPKSAVLAGLACAIISGICVIAAASSSVPWIIMAWLASSRIWLGAAESGTGTGCITWGIGQTGAAHMASVMSWNGVASYGGIALGAPTGVFLYQCGGLAALGMATMGLSAIGLGICTIKPGAPVVAGARMGFTRVLRHVLPYGTCLALGSIGFGTLVAFITLFYASHHWHNAAYALSAFGVAFVLVRVTLSGMIRRYGGLTASAVSLAVEAAGLMVLWRAGSAEIALLGAALTGLGLSLVFPAMAVEALKDVPVSNRGAA